MKRTRTLLRRLAVFVGACLLLILVFLTEENLRGRFLLSQLQHRLQARHEPFTLAELSLPAAPGANSRPSAVLLAAKELEALARTHPLAAAGPRYLGLTEPGRAPVRHRAPTFPSTLARGRPPAGQGQPPPVYEWSQLERELAAADAPLARLRAALMDPASAPVVDYGNVAGRFEPAPWQAQRWLLSAGLDALHAHRLDDAVENIVALLSLADYLRKDRRALTQISAQTTVAFTLPLIWEALQAEGWTEAQLARLQTALAGAHPLEDAVASCEVERALLSVRFAGARQSGQARDILFRNQGHDLIEDLIGDKEVVYPSESVVWLKSALWWAAWSYQDEAVALTRWQPFLEEARRLRAEKSWVAFERRYPVVALPPADSAAWKHVLSDLVDPSAERTLLARIVRVETGRQMSLAALALKRHTLRTGGIPPSLAALVPDLLPALPLDLMNGQPLRYHATDAKNFVLYSVGTNGQDDGGDPRPLAGAAKPLDLWSGRDVLWPAAIPPPPEAP